MKHTPGKWITNKNQIDCGEDKISIETEEECFIAQVDAGMNQEANARLITAAPELLEALQALFKLASENLPLEECEEYEQAKAAIQKATGE